MFSLKEFVKKGLLDAVGKMADYQVILNAAGWHEKGVLTEEDLSQISEKIDIHNGVAAQIPTDDGDSSPTEEELVEDTENTNEEETENV